MDKWWDLSSIFTLFIRPSCHPQPVESRCIAWARGVLWRHFRVRGWARVQETRNVPKIVPETLIGWSRARCLVFVLFCFVVCTRRVHKHYLVAWLCSHAILYLASDMGLQHLTFTSKNLQNKKKSTPVGIMNSAGSNRKSVVNSVGVCSMMWML